MRLFVALDIPENVRMSLAAFVAKIRTDCGSARWVRIENVHLTLKFIGHVPDGKLQAIETALQAVPLTAPFKISFRGLGFFPSERRPRVLWAGVDACLELNALAEAIEISLEPLGIAREQRIYSPHLTLARFESGKGLDNFKCAIAAARLIEFGATTATQFHLYQSVLNRGGAEYTRLATYELGKDTAL